MAAALYPGDPFTTKRRRTWSRSKSQAHYRGEEWRLSFPDFCRLWSSEELWGQRGRHNEGLVLVRLDPEKPWQLTNCAIITRYNQLRASIERKMGRSPEPFLEGALYYE